MDKFFLPVQPHFKDLKSCTKVEFLGFSFSVNIENSNLSDEIPNSLIMKLEV